MRRMERLEVEVWRDTLAAAPERLRAAIGLDAAPFAGGLAMRCRALPTLLYNRAFGFGLEDPFGAAELERIVRHFPAGAEFTIQPSPACVFEGARAWLDARGMRSWFDWVCWSRALDAEAPDAPSDLAIAEVAPHEADAFAELCTGIFDERPLAPVLAATVGRAGWRSYVARDGGRAVATGMLFVHGRDAWLGWGATLASHRGRGAQSALVARRLRDARAMGATHARVETADDLPGQPNPSFRNMRRAGFTLLYRRPSHAHLLAPQTRAD